MNPGRHGLHFLGVEENIWVPGLVAPKNSPHISMLHIPLTISSAHDPTIPPPSTTAGVDEELALIDWEDRYQLSSFITDLQKLDLKVADIMVDSEEDETSDPLSDSDIQELAQNVLQD